MAVSTRWTVMAALAAGIAAIAGLASATPRARRPSTRPNVVVLMTDDQTVESMRVMPNVKTLLADQGVTFDNSFVSYPLCCPSRATFLTGQYAHNHGVWGNAAPNGGYYKLDSTNTLPVWLQRAGYQTIHLGKYLNGYGTRSQTEIPPGWGEWYGSLDPSTYRFRDYTLNENGKLVTYGTDSGQLPDGRLGAEGGRHHRAPGGRPAAVLPLGRLPRAAQRRAARPGRSERPGDAVAGAAPPQPLRDAGAPDSALVQRGRRLRQAGRRSATGRC